MVRDPNAIDFWRGFALITIFVNHIPGIYFERFTHRNISLSDSAELFVFLAGWALRILYDRSEDNGERGQLLYRVGSRALTIYAAHLVLVCVAIAMLAASATALDNPLLLEWHNAAAVFYDPVRAHLGLVALTHQLGYFDILPLYVVLMAVAAPLIVVIHWKAPALLLPASIAIYLAALVFRISLPMWPTAGHWFFNPLAWQLVFVLGFSLAGTTGAGAIVRRNIDWLRIVSVPVLALGAAVVLFDLWPDPTKLPEPKLLFLVWKSYLTPPRLLQFLALVAVMSAAYPFIAKAIPPVVHFLARLGRNSLSVFCVGSLLSLAAQIVRFVYKGGIGFDAIIVIGGIAVLGLTAAFAEWPRSRGERKQGTV